MSLSESAALLQQIVDPTEGAIVGEGLDGKITGWNRAAQRAFGYTIDEAIGQPVELIVPPEMRAELQRARDRALRENRSEVIETSRIAKGGGRVKVVLTLSSMKGASGRVVGLSHMFRGFGARRTPEWQAQHLMALVGSSEDAIISKDLNGVIQTWNPAAERVFGYPESEAVGKSIRIIIPRERWGEEDEVLRRVCAGERIEHFETIRRRKDGSLVSISLTISPIRNASSEIIGASKIARDVSLQLALEMEKNRLGAIVDSSDDAIVSKDLHGIIQTWNRAAERMFGFSAEEAIGGSITLIIPDDRLHEEGEVLSRVSRGLRVDHFETLRRRKDGTLIPISLTVSPVRDHAGQIVGASKTARDLSALRAYATTLEQTVRQRTASLELANSQLESFAYSVSHDLRAPLRGMHGLAHALLQDYGPSLDDTARDYAQRIVLEAIHLDQLIQDLLAYSRLTRIDVTLDAVDVREVVEAALHNLDEDIRHARASIEIEPNLPKLKANRPVLTQVLTNLISNAIKFGGTHPPVRVRAEQDNGIARIWVEDQGIGIDPRYHERIFRAFERLHGVEEYPGTGIGLAIVLKGIERLGGRVGVNSQEGRGSQFWFELPEAQTA
jgi:PAS domain S-box-containing protein